MAIRLSQVKARAKAAKALPVVRKQVNKKKPAKRATKATRKKAVAKPAKRPTKKVVTKPAKRRAKKAIAKPVKRASKPVKRTTKKVVAKPTKRATQSAIEKRILLKAAKDRAAREAKKAAKIAAEQAALQAALKEAKREAAFEKRAAKAAEKAAALAAEKASKQVTKVYGPKSGQKKLAAIVKESGPIAVAELLRTTPATLKRWLEKGPSSKGLLAITQLVKNRKAAKDDGKKEKQAFEQLLKLAGELGELPKHRTTEKRRAGRNTVGKMFVKGWNTGLSYALVDEITAWIVSRSKTPEWNYWQAIATVSQFGKADVAFQGYKTVYKQLPHPRAGDFAIESTISTHRSTKLREVSDDLRGDLEELMQSGLLTHVHSTTVYNYKWRTEDQARLRDTMERRKRKKLWERKLLRAETKSTVKK